MGQVTVVTAVITCKMEWKKATSKAWIQGIAKSKVIYHRIRVSNPPMPWFPTWTGLVLQKTLSGTQIQCSAYTISSSVTIMIHLNEMELLYTSKAFISTEANRKALVEGIVCPCILPVCKIRTGMYSIYCSLTHPLFPIIYSLSLPLIYCMTFQHNSFLV